VGLGGCRAQCSLASCLELLAQRDPAFLDVQHARLVAGADAASAEAKRWRCVPERREGGVVHDARHVRARSELQARQAAAATPLPAAAEMPAAAAAAVRAALHERGFCVKGSAVALGSPARATASCISSLRARRVPPRMKRV